LAYGKRIAAIELRHLRYFVAIAEEGSVTRAAERLGIAQPPLSQQLRALEEEVGAPLLVRSFRGVHVTEAGQILLDGARKILNQVEETLAATRRAGRGERGYLKVGYTSSAAFNICVPGAIGSFRRGFPDIVLAMEEACTAELIESLRSKKVDVAFVRAPLHDIEGLVVESLIEEDMVAAVPAHHRLAKTGKRHGLLLADLADETVLLYRRPPGPGLYDTILAAYRGAGLNPRLGQETPRMVGALNLVASGLGISLVPKSMQRVDSGAVAYLPLKGTPRLTAPIHLAYREEDATAAALSFINCVLASRQQPRLPARSPKSATTRS
jgi:DNA-binding transcriptional LysR family regulator